MTVDYERGNFTVSQCAWQDGAPEQINAILSPAYADSKNSTISASSSKHRGTGAIAGAAIAGIIILAAAGCLGYFIYQQRAHRRPKSIAPTEDIGLTNVDNKDSKAQSLQDDPNSPYPEYKKLDAFSNVHREREPDGELGTQGEIHQMPTTEHEQGDYFSAVINMISERRAATTPQIDGRSVVYELHGSEPVPVEMDDERSRSGLSPMLSPKTPVTRGSSRASSLGPVSDTL